jgi:hypothetical protein
MTHHHLTSTFLAAILLAFAHNAVAQTSGDQPIERAAFALKSCTEIQHGVRNYLKALRSDNDGVVESALYYAALLKRDVRNECFSCLKREVDKLANNGRTERIRHKAYLVRAAYDDPKLLPAADDAAQSPDDFFAALSDRLERQVFGGAAEQTKRGK